MVVNLNQLFIITTSIKAHVENHGFFLTSENACLSKH
jgi:hypothetical protein